VIVRGLALLAAFALLAIAPSAAAQVWQPHDGDRLVFDVFATDRNSAAMSSPSGEPVTTLP